MHRYAHTRIFFTCAGTSGGPVVIAADLGVHAGAVCPKHCSSSVSTGPLKRTLCACDATGRVHQSFPIEHSAQGFAVLLRHLGKLAADRADIPIGIERPDGRLVDALLEAGHSIVPVSPNAIKAWREGEVVCGAKSDPGDAHVIGEYLRLRAHRLRPAVPFSAQTKALRTVVRTRDDLVQMRVAATNQLCALLDLHWPGAKVVFADVASPIALNFLTRYPTPLSATRLGEKRMAAFCTKHGYTGRRDAGELLTRLRQAPAGISDPTLTQALREAVLAMVAVVRATVGATKNLDRCVATRQRHQEVQRRTWC